MKNPVIISTPEVEKKEKKKKAIIINHWVKSKGI